MTRPEANKYFKFTGRLQQQILVTTALTGTAMVTLSLFLLPMVYGMVTALKDPSQAATIGAPWWPASERTFTYDGKQYDIYKVPMPDGETRPMALYKKGRAASQLIDPENPEAGPIEWVGVWRQLEQDWAFDPRWSNFTDAWNTVDFPLLLGNTVMYAGVTTFGAVFSAAVVAYGFARFRIPHKNILFMLMLSTVIMPGMVLMIPQYYIFLRLGWVGTWLPLIVPAFFSWGTNVFLLRQFFMSIPRELDEAAMIDGASPLKVFTSIILPQSTPALTAVALFHFFWCWNDFFGPLMYLSGSPDRLPITVGLTAFSTQYSQQTNLILASALISVIIPLVVISYAQRFFKEGAVGMQTRKYQGQAPRQPCRGVPLARGRRVTVN